MYFSGQSGGLGQVLSVLVPVEISGQWETLASTAGSMAAEASSVAVSLDSAASSWRGLVSSYEESATQDVVWSALDEVPEVTREWSDVAARAADVLQAFATEAAGLESQASALGGQALRLQALLWASDLLTGDGESSAEDDALRVKIQRHNDDVLALNSRWEQVQQQAVEELDSLAGRGGLEEEIPVVDAGGGSGFFGAGGAFGGGGFASMGGRFPVDGQGPGGFGFHAAVAQMIGSGMGAGNDDPVETAQELFDQMIDEDATGEDVQNFRDHVAQMDAAEIQEFSETTPAVHENSVPQPSSEEQYEQWPSGEDGHAWWESLEDAGIQDAMMTHLPLLVGNVQGVPYEKRAEANYDALQRLKDNPDYNDWDENLKQIDRSLRETDEGDPPKLLLSLDVGQRAEAAHPNAPGNNEPHGWERQPLAAISVGNPDTADTTSFGAPGMASGTHKMQDEVDMAEVLHEDLEKADMDSHAVVSWVGYDAPPGPGDGPVSDVWRDDRASQGGWQFAYALDGFHETRTAGGDDEGDFTVNVHAHSYGTNMSAHALTRVQHEVDTFSMYGSSGIPDDVAEHASDFKVATNGDGEPMVFASQSSHDGTAGWGRIFGLGGRQDPTDEDFGAQTYYSGGGHNSDAVTGEDVTGHSRSDDELDRYGYLDPGTQHFRNLSSIISGKGMDNIVTQDDYHDGVSMSEKFRDFGKAL